MINEHLNKIYHGLLRTLYRDESLRERLLLSFVRLFWGEQQKNEEVHRLHSYPELRTMQDSDWFHLVADAYDD